MVDTGGGSRCVNEEIPDHVGEEIKSGKSLGSS
jgi:hypothetical protein